MTPSRGMLRLARAGTTLGQATFAVLTLALVADPVGAQIDAGPAGPPQIVLDAVLTTAIDASDIDGDGDQDLFVALDDQVRLGWLENLDGLGTFGPPRAIVTGSEFDEVVDLHAVDLDEDGDDDLIVGDDDGNQIVWFENLDGLGTFSATGVVIEPGASGPKRVCSADIDGDGDLDVMAATEGPNRLFWYEHLDGDGAFGPQQEISDEFGRPEIVVPADLNGDGLPDALSYATSLSPIHSILMGWCANQNGGAGWSAAELILDGQHEQRFITSIDAADIDGDGHLDVVASYETDPPFGLGDDGAFWYRNQDGLGTFDDAIAIATELTLSDCHGVVPADLDRDGDVDVTTFWLGTTGDDEAYLHRNRGPLPVFSTPVLISQDLSISNNATVPVVFADLDGDDDEDMVITTYFASNDLLAFGNTLGTPDWPFLGEALPAGLPGASLLQAEGALEPGGPISARLTGGLPFGITNLVVGMSELSLPFKGGVMVPALDGIQVSLPLDGTGALIIVDTWPSDAPAGIELWLQFWTADPAGPAGLTASNAVMSTSLP
jgi:hypothetical protein